MDVASGVSFRLAKVEEVEGVEVNSLNGFGDIFTKISGVASVHVETMEEDDNGGGVGS